MPVFNYLATDYTGHKIKGRIEAKDRVSVINSLRKTQLIIISVTELKEKEGGLLRKSGAISLEDLVVFSRQLSALVKAGISLVRGLNILFAQVENKRLKEIISAVVSKIEAGSSLSDALAGYPKVFSPFYINMIRAGEFSGALDTILERLALYLESVGKLNRKVKSAFVYPVAVISVALLITSLLFVLVIPKFKEIFMTLGVSLPPATRLVIGISELFKKFFYLVPVIVVILVVALKWLTNIPQLKLAQDRLKLNLPVVGRVIRKVAVARFSRTLSTLLKSGVSILAALEIGSATAGNKVIEDALDKVIMRVSKGERIGESLAENKVFAPLVVNLIAVGEETGDIGSMLDKIATFYEDEVDNAVLSLTSLIEPFIIIFLGVVIGGIVLAIFLPILQLSQLVGR
ncbi:MAG: type II secretion system F family protein [Candidatus Omnitrophica bacterium]|nr:type II secretion system F family protein [Candidatus Omnitrophota bacterium]